MYIANDNNRCDACDCRCDGNIHECEYIEPETPKEDTPVNPGDDDYNANLNRWKWLLDSWSNMDFETKFSLFYPYYHYINPRDYYKKDFDKYITEDVYKTGFKICRSVDKIRFDPDGQGVPNIIVIYKAINIGSIPYEDLKKEIEIFYQNYVA